MEQVINQQLFTKEQVAMKLSISSPTLDRYVKEGKIKSTRIGRLVRFTATDIQDALRKMEAKTAK